MVEKGTGSTADVESSSVKEQHRTRPVHNHRILMGTQASAVHCGIKSVHVYTTMHSTPNRYNLPRYLLGGCISKQCNYHYHRAKPQKIESHGE